MLQVVRPHACAIGVLALELTSCTLEPQGFKGRFDAPPGLDGVESTAAGGLDDDESSDSASPTTSDEASSGGAGADAEDDGTTAGVDGGDTSSSGGAAATSGALSESDDGGGSSSGDAGTDAGDQPQAGMWAPCTAAAQCEVGLGCLTNDTHTDGFCSAQCAPVGDPTSCGPAPGSTPVVCHMAGGGESVCALDCALDQACPGGMACTDTDVCM